MEKAEDDKKRNFLTDDLYTEALEMKNSRTSRYLSTMHSTPDYFATFPKDEKFQTA